ncbi:MAG TPA: hypothetical protein VKB80_07395 [Kofleriaceae bacterium]|nr:hypothetical protein [Kofleriaceae bacterium]
MNPIVSWVVAHTVARKRARRCPRCGHTQIPSAARARDAVPCERCRTPIPAPPAPRR